jgi:hypothetical protein
VCNILPSLQPTTKDGGCGFAKDPRLLLAVSTRSAASWDLPFHPDLLRCAHVEMTPRRTTRHLCAEVLVTCSNICDYSIHSSDLTRLRINNYGQVTLSRTGCYVLEPILLPPRRPALPGAFIHMFTMPWCLTALGVPGVRRGSHA